MSPSDIGPVDRPWSLSIEELTERLRVDVEGGLSAGEVQTRLEQFGPNRLRESARRSRLMAFLGQFADLMIGLLAVAALISAVVGDWQDSLLIAAIVLANAVIGYVQEQRAEEAVEALKKMSQPTARVWRDSALAEVPTEDLVPGDLIELSGGSLVPADGRLIEAAALQVNESPLTGESLPVEKQAEPIASEAGLPDRNCMVHAGTSISQGHGRAVVVATGMSTELGKIAGLLESSDVHDTPLERRMAALSKRLAVAVVVICIVVFVLGIVRGETNTWTMMLLTAVSLAVAAIPEGLPAVITVTLALGSRKMAERRAIIRQLAAVETLGSVNVICTDKTGTLTRNEMTVADVDVVGEPKDGDRMLWEAAVLCNDAQLTDSGDILGSATEVALVDAARQHGIDPVELRAKWPRVAEFPFSSDRKRMTTVHRGPNGMLRIYVKGAAEQILSRSTQLAGSAAAPELDEPRRAQLETQTEDLAESGRRMLAVALHRQTRDRLPQSADEVESDLHLLGLVGLVDPPRAEARDAVAQCRHAGIRVVMITGDHRGTAQAVASELDILGPDDHILTGADMTQLDDDALAERAPQVAVYARVAPEHKLRIVRAHQSRGSVVAMTGDGVNDAPALKQADIGIAMGITGTDVSKEAAKMVLADDNFATIVAAVEEGRVVYDNIRKFVRYLLTANISEILVLVLAIVAGWPLPLLPIHLLWINLVTDGLPALALGFEPPERHVMRRKPRRRDESMFAGGMAWEILGIGLLMALVCLGLFWAFLPFGATPADDDPYARTIVFFTLSTMQLFYVLALRSTEQSFFTLGPWTNWRLSGAVVLGIVLQLAVVYVPALAKIFHTVPMEPRHLAIALAASTSGFIAVELEKLVPRRRTA